MSKILWKEPTAKSFIDRSELHVWRFNLDIEISRYEKFIPILSTEEIQRANKFLSKKDYYQHLAAHIIKRIVLGRYLNISPKLLQFKTEQYGKPTLSKIQNYKNIQFNISHTNNLVLIAITIEDDIGIDVEYNSRKISIKNLGDFILSPIEKQFFSKITSPQEKRKAFFRCWTRKEAYLKARGIGLTVNLTNISVDMRKIIDSLDWLKTLTIDQIESIEWKLFPLEIDRFYTAAVVATSFQKHLLGYDAKYFAS